ncbi:hypothetical protein DFQ28_010818 [Apophysomyces sp. BC1034]|nr:hypothetical protein DFQ30_010569 [Apophysomyces sp. BC1015]KAG0170213.1 hypothetical protein DFQ29_009371 [Apophysomyces sp. BC1021]KAG0184623.1 hypothetical protein DFQ28_010818 [Apophysomyces sp. BC1034]
MATLVLPRFSGSTLEPSTQPIVIHPHETYASSLQTTEDKEILKVEPTRCTKPLRRQHKPAYIAIPDAFDMMDGPISHEEEEAEDQPWLVWDEESQSIKVAPKYQNNGDIPPWIMAALLSPFSDDSDSSCSYSS